MDQGQRRLDPLVRQVGVERAQLPGREHALVDDGPRRQRREVGRRAAGDRGLVVDLVLDALAQRVDAPVEGQARGPRGVGQEELPHDGQDLPGRLAEDVRLDRDVPPAHRLQALLGHQPLDGGHRLLPRHLVGGQEAQPDRVLAGRREREADDLPEEAVGDLEQDAGPVTRVGLGPGGAAVLEVAERPDGQVDDAPAGSTLDVHDERDATGVVLEPRVVEPDWARLASAHHPHPRSLDGWVDAGTALARQCVDASGRRPDRRGEFRALPRSRQPRSRTASSGLPPFVRGRRDHSPAAVRTGR